MDQLKSPYGVFKTLDWIYNYAKGGNFSNPAGLQDLPKSYVLSQKPIDSTVAFIGDLMGTSGKSLQFSSELIQWFQDAELIVANLEGPLVEKEDIVFIKQHNSARLLQDLSQIRPLKHWAFSLANNHTFDYGPTGVQQTTKEILDQGAQFFGLKSKPKLEYKDLCIWGGADFSNVKNDWVQLNSEFREQNDQDPEKYQILFTHWGQEFYFYPGIDQIQTRQKNYYRFDFLIGHHSHTPQPVVFEDGKGTAYSLGNFYIYFNKTMMKKGKILKLHFSGQELVQINWAWSVVTAITKDRIQIDIKKP